MSEKISTEGALYTSMGRSPMNAAPTKMKGL
jgi:hypothetical protein